MSGQVLAWLAGAITTVISASGYVGIAALMAIESACIPLPSEIIMPFSGYLVSVGRFSLLLVATAGALGCNIGSAVAYEIGAYGGRKLVERWGSRVLVSRREIAWADRFFARWGGLAVLIGRVLPVVRTFVALPAGIARMPRLRFHVYTFVGSWVWCLALAYAGMQLGERWNSDPRLKAVFHQLDFAIAGILALAVAVFVITRWRASREAQ